MTETKQERSHGLIAVIGARDCDEHIYRQAETAGRMLAQQGYGIICGGMGGVMEAACKGAERANGLTVGILPGDDPLDANDFVRVPVATGLGIARNVIIVKSALAVLAIGGKYGTLSEIAFALQLNKPVIALGSWDLGPPVVTAPNVTEAINEILKSVE